MFLEFETEFENSLGFSSGIMEEKKKPAAKNVGLYYYVQLCGGNKPSSTKGKIQIQHEHGRITGLDISCCGHHKTCLPSEAAGIQPCPYSTLHPLALPHPVFISCLGCIQ
jgi:hypothetical protein